MTSDYLPSRAILNFTHRCAMRCEWCYVAFNTPPARKAEVLEVVERIAALGFTKITIGGGDPFQYKFLPEVLHLARSLSLFVHVDSHAKNLKETDENLQLIQSAIDLIGLPLDGSCPSVHDGMRSSPGHFDQIQSRLRWLAQMSNRLKINTVISNRNAHNVPELSKLIANLAPVRWSIYQYWPIGPGSKVESLHGIPDRAFLDICEGVNDALSSTATTVEVNSRDSRRDTYPIINHDGEVFVHTAAPADNFTSLGSVFADEIVARIGKFCAAERDAAKSRYMKLRKV